MRAVAHAELAAELRQCERPAAHEAGHHGHLRPREAAALGVRVGVAEQNLRHFNEVATGRLIALLFR